MAFIVMEHKETGSAPVAVDEQAFRDVWARKGWTKVTKASRKTLEAITQAEAQAVADGEAEAFAEAEAAAKKQLKTVKADAKARTAKRLKGGK